VVVALELQLLDLGFELVHDDVAMTLTDIDDRKQKKNCSVFSGVCNWRSASERIVTCESHIQDVSRILLGCK